MLVDDLCVSSCRCGEPSAGFAGGATGANDRCYGVVEVLLGEVVGVIFLNIELSRFWSVASFDAGSSRRYFVVMDGSSLLISLTAVMNDSIVGEVLLL